MKSKNQRSSALELAGTLAVLALAGSASADVSFTTLHSFQTNDGFSPMGLMQASDGIFYGTTEDGTVFKMTPGGALTTVVTFGEEIPLGPNPNEVSEGPLVEDKGGNFYGTTPGDIVGPRTAPGSGGSVFKMTSVGMVTNFVAFSDSSGTAPRGLVLANDGNLYGTTGDGGPPNGDGAGTVFQISTNGALTTLYSFTGTNDGGYPVAGLVQARDGSFYGTTSYGGTNGGGTVFRINTNGMLTTLYSFDNGAWPTGTLVQGADGYFYGTTENGGAVFHGGTVFRISSDGALSNLYSFEGEGGGPEAGLVQGSDGCFYGTTVAGGDYGSGAVFKIRPNGTLTTIHSFNSADDGANPDAALVQGSDGSFYGTTTTGGVGGGGTVFRITIVPEIQSMTLTSGILNLLWTTEAGGAYQLQYRSDLVSSDWTNLGNAVVATSSTLNFTDSPTSDQQRFYRLMLAP